MAQHDDKVAEAQAREQQRFAEYDEAQINRAMLELLETEQGQKFLWWLLQIGQYGMQPFAADPLKTAFNCGELNIGNQVMLRICEVNPTGFAQLQENRKQENERRSEHLSRVSASTIGDSAGTDTSA